MTDQASIFLGRGRQMEALARVVDAWRSADPKLPQVALIYGQGGIGKTTLLAKFRASLAGDDLVLHIDWQIERDLDDSPFRAVRERVAASDLLSTLAQRTASALGRPNKNYDKTLKDIRAAEADLEKAVASQDDTRPPSGAAHDLTGVAAGGAAVGVGLAAGAPAPLAASTYAAGKGGYNWLREKFSWRPAESLHRALASLRPAQKTLLHRRDLTLAAALAKDLQLFAQRRRLLVSFDTYEIVAGVDALVREMVKVAGPRVAWIIAGRDDIYSARGGMQGETLGYEAEDREAYAVELINLRALAKQDLAEYFHIKASDREPPRDEELDRLYRATRGIPFVIKLASDIWARGGSVEDIGDGRAASDPDIVQGMVERYLKHCVPDDADRRALASIAMADGDPRVLRAMIEPELEAESYESRLTELHDRHAAVHRSAEGGLRLHDDAAEFFEKRLEGEWRNEPWTRRLAERAGAVCNGEMERAIGYHQTLDALCEDQSYIDASASAAHYLFWVDTDEACRLITRRVVEGLAHNSVLCQSVVDVATKWQARLDDRSSKRIGVLRRGRHSVQPQARADLVRLLDDDHRRGWLVGDGAEAQHGTEREAIRDWLAAGSLRRAERLDEALERCEKSAGKLPSRGSLRRIVADEAHAICYQHYSKKQHRRELRAAGLAVRADPAYARAWCSLGVAHGNCGEHEKALEHKLKALELDDTDARHWCEVGNSYGWLGEHEKALEHHLKALELDDTDARNWREVGVSYGWLGEHEKALEHRLKALELDDTDARNWRAVGVSYGWLGEFEKALEHNLKASELDDADANILTSLGLAYKRLGSYEAAEESLRRATEVDGCSADNWSRLSQLYLLLRRHGDAGHAVDRALAMGATHSISLTMQAMLGLFTGQAVATTAADLAKALPTHALCEWGRALQYGDKGRWEEAAGTFKQQAEAERFEPAPRTGFWAARRLVDPGYVPDEDFVRETRRLVERKPTPVAAAWLAGIEAEPEAALDALEHAIQHTPGTADEARFRPEFVRLREHPRFQALTRPLKP